MKDTKQINKFQLYGLFSPINDELKYIGITKNGLTTRLNSHLRKPTNNKIGLWFKELAELNRKPIIKEIKECENYTELLLSERYEIKKQRELGVKLFNILDGGDINPMLGRTHSPEARLKISLAHKGRKMTEEQIKNRKELLTKLWSNEEWANRLREKFSKIMIGNNRAYGLKHSEDTKKLLSNLHKGNTYTLGFKHSEETKNTMRNNNLGENNPMFCKSLSKETLKKRSEKVINEGTHKGKNNGNFKFDIIKDDLIDLYINKNLKIEEIASIYGCHRTTISDNLKIYEIKKEPSNIYNLNMSKINTYLESGLNQVQIGQIYNCSNKIINKFIKNNKNE